MQAHLEFFAQCIADFHAQTLLTFFDQDALEDVLRRHLSTRFGVSVELGTKVESFDQFAGHVDVRLQKTLDGEPKEETVRAQYLVGTDGGRSTIRRALNLGFMPGARSETRGIVYGDAVITGLEEQVCCLWLSPAYTVTDMLSTRSHTGSATHRTRCTSGLLSCLVSRLMGTAGSLFAHQRGSGATAGRSSLLARSSRTRTVWRRAPRHSNTSFTRRRAARTSSSQTGTTSQYTGMFVRCLVRGVTDGRVREGLLPA
jgi:2-polyprenyl-6-methoxyphenol hydroxylase-like FAD-dependent oxidoreductase